MFFEIPKSIILVFVISGCYYFECNWLSIPLLIYINVSASYIKKCGSSSYNLIAATTSKNKETCRLVHRSPPVHCFYSVLLLLLLCSWEFNPIVYFSLCSLYLHINRKKNRKYTWRTNQYLGITCDFQVIWDS